MYATFSLYQSQLNEFNSLWQKTIEWMNANNDPDHIYGSFHQSGNSTFYELLSVRMPVCTRPVIAKQTGKLFLEVALCHPDLEEKEPLAYWYTNGYFLYSHPESIIEYQIAKITGNDPEPAWHLFAQAARDSKVFAPRAKSAGIL